ncbi:CRTAC1 family protein [Actinomadura litoris]|nr:CRTAC1 family protein [Actinomadura litoris]
MIYRSRIFSIGLSAVCVSAMAGYTAVVPPASAAPGGEAERRPGTGFTEIAVRGSGLADYRRGPSPEHAIRLANKKKSQITFGDYANEPVHDHGIAGVVTFDADGDGDLDLYVTNGPGRPNSLYRNTLGRRGRVSFTDVGRSSGAALTNVDSNGACAGDIDNDGRTDLYVLGRNANNHLLRNRGNGTFQDITTSSRAGAGTSSHASCTMGDFDGDGLLDIAIANSFDMKKAAAIFAVPYALNQQNQLLRNAGGRRFTDAGESSGFAKIVVTNPPPKETGPTSRGGTTPHTPRNGSYAEISWAIAAVDYDQDGDLDIMDANDQAAYPMKKYGGLDRGLLRIHRNDGHGRFTDVTHQVGTDQPGAWMGLAYGDFNFDGNLDVFDSSGGDYMFLPLPEMGIKQGDLSSRWILQRPDHTFADPRASGLRNPTKDGADPTLGGLNATPWGWGASTLDYDNDGATDIIYHGALDGMFWVTSDNPGALLRNQGPGALRKGFYPSFRYDDAVARATDHRRRTVTGVSVGDLNQDGFDDIVSVAQSRKVGKLTPYSDDGPFDFGSPFDDANYLRTYQRTGGGPSVPSITLQPTPTRTVDGDLSVQLNDGNRNRSASVRAFGSVGLTRGARVNRDGVGAVVKFTPRRGPAAVRPVIAGSSFASQDALEGTFGMGRQRSGTVEVLWPGGVRNRLYGVRAGERIAFPEIPCSYTDRSVSFRRYTRCVRGALGDLVQARRLSRGQAARFYSSAVRAYNEKR